MNKLLKWSHFLKEVLIVFLVLLVSYSYLQEERVTIKSDGKGYYEYLPAIFIYNDLSWSYLDTLNTPGYYNHNEYSVGAIVGPKDERHNKYLIGTAILMAPFFSLAHVYAKTNDYPADGYSLPYQKAMWFSALFYLWCGLFFMRKLLLTLKIRCGIIFLTQVLVVFSTPLLHYTTFEPTFSHVYSFASVTALFYSSSQFFLKRKNKHLYLFFLILALTFLIRPFNILIAPAVFFLFKNVKQFKQFIKRTFLLKPLPIFISIGSLILILSLQSLIWYIQKGELLIDSYSKESFDFTNPHIFKLLFSYKKGLFVYSPALFIGLIIGLFYAIRDKKYFSIFAIGIPLLIFTYVLSCWWSWWHGMSFGQRPYIDILILFAITIAYALNQLSKKQLFLISLLLIITVPITVIQCFQYKNYIIHWSSMNKEVFWETFLKTGDRYRGLLWHEKKEHTKQQIVFKSIINSEKIIAPEKEETLLEFKNISSVISDSFDMVELTCDIKDHNKDSKIILSLTSKTGSIVYWNQIFTYHETRGAGSKKRANFQFFISKKDVKKAENLYLVAKADDKALTIYRGEIKLVSFNQKHTEFYQEVLKKYTELKNNKAYDRKATKKTLMIEAEHMVVKEFEKAVLKSRIKSTPEWFLEIQKKANDRGLPVETILEEDISFILKNK